MSKIAVPQAGNGRMDGKQSQDQQQNAGALSNVSAKSEVVSSSDSEEGKEEEPLFRIKSENDTELFEQEENGDDDGGDDDYMNDFLTPEVHLEEKRTRKRKQDMNIQINSDYLEELQRLGLTEDDYLSECFKTVTEEESFSSKRDKDRFIPLYKLNPDDFIHDPRKRIQIKRAIITYRHHQLKKWTIISQRKEINQLRSHTNALIAKIMELRGCGCEKNQDVSIEIIDKVIPPSKLSEKIFSHVKWPDSESFEFEALLPPVSLKKTPPKKIAEQPVPPAAAVTPKKSEVNPILVNIHSSRLANLTSKPMEATTMTSSPVSPLKKSIGSIGTSIVKPKPSPFNRSTTFGPCVDFNVKRRIPFSSLSPKKYDNKSPATAVPASKLALMKKDFNKSTLGPLYFLSRSMSPNPNSNYHQLQAPLSPTLQFINSAKANSTVANTDSVGRWKIKPGYQPTLSKPGTVSVSALGSLNEEIKKREMEKLSLEQKFKLLDGDNEEEEGAILAAFSPKNHQRKRKQAISQDRMYEEKKKESIIDQLGNHTRKGVVDISQIKAELEERYSDVIFEEAD